MKTEHKKKIVLYADTKKSSLFGYMFLQGAYEMY